MAHPTLPTDLLYPIITLVFESWLDDYLTLDGNPSSRLDESNPMKQLLIVSFNVRQVTLRIMSDKLGFKLQIEGIWRYVALLAGWYRQLQRQTNDALSLSVNPWPCIAAVRAQRCFKPLEVLSTEETEKITEGSTLLTLLVLESTIKHVLGGIRAAHTNKTASLNIREPYHLHLMCSVGKEATQRILSLMPHLDDQDRGLYKRCCEALVPIRLGELLLFISLYFWLKKSR